MKPFLLMAFSIASVSCFAQEEKPNSKILWEKVRPGNWKMEQWVPGVGTKKYTPAATPLLQGYIGGRAVPAGVYALPGSGMPCVVPDRTAIARMPNGFGPVSVPFKTQIPNVHPQPLPQGSIPSK
jgi:hypothetical protein